MLQYITNTNCGKDILTQVKAVLDGGCRWIQLRMKGSSTEEIIEMGKKVKELCDPLEAYLIINDNVEACKQINASGVHLGKTDMLPSKARIELGPLAVIGVTANTFDDIIAVRSLDVDYIGLGPYRETVTKENLAPLLGLDGITSLCDKMLSEEINIAHVAVGGIRLEDVQPLLEAGVNGIAVSGAIANAEDMTRATKQFVELLPVGE